MPDEQRLTTWKQLEYAIYQAYSHGKLDKFAYEVQRGLIGGTDHSTLTTVTDAIFEELMPARTWEYDVLNPGKHVKLDLELTRLGQKGWRYKAIIGRDIDNDPLILIERETTTDA